MRLAPPSSNDSLRRAATRRLEGSGPTDTFGAWLKRALRAEEANSETALVAITLLTGCTVISAWLASWSPRVLPSLAPDDAGDAIVAVWQVHASIVGLGIPLLVLLIEQARGRSVLATSAGQAMVSRSGIVFTTIFSLGAVVQIGLSAIYIDSDGALVVSMAVSSASVLLILWAYASALSHLLSPRRLRERSFELLERRLRSSMKEALIVDRMNEILFTELKRWSPSALTSSELEQEDWHLVTAAATGRIVDVQIRSITSLMGRFATPSGVGDAGPQPVDSRPSPSTPARDARILIRLVGDRVQRGDVLLAIGPEPHGVPPVDALAATFAIESNDDF